MLWSVVTTRTHTQPSSGKRGTRRRTAGYAGDFLPSHRDSAGSNKPTHLANKYSGDTPPHQHCVLGRPLRRRLPQRPRCKSGLALSRERHSSRQHTPHVSTAARSRRLSHHPPSLILTQSLSNSNLIGLTLLLVKAVIGPSLRKMSLRAGAVLCLQELFTATDGPWFRIKGEIIASGDDFFPSPPPKNVLRSTYSSTQYRRYVLEVLF